MTGQAELNLSDGRVNDTTGNLLFRDSVPIFVKESIAGGVASGLSKTAVAPLERVKILFQTRLGNFQRLGIWRSLAHLYKTEGFWSLYKGNGAAVARIVPYGALNFVTYERYQQLLIREYPSLGPSVHLFAGALAGGTSVIFTYPLDLARTRLAYQVGSGAQAVYTDLGHVLRSAFKEGGFRGLYRGLSPTLLGILPYAGLKFYLYERLKGCLAPEQEKTVFGKLACASVAGLVGQTCIYPLDVVRRQMQVQEISGTGKAFKGTLDGLIHVIRKQGWRQTFSGATINYFKVAPSTAITLVVYDIMKVGLGIAPQPKS